MFKTIIFVGIGGATGSIFRFLIAFFMSKIWTHSFPISTFIVNALGCFLIGFFSCLLKNNSSLHWLLIAGFCGGFTTFSTFSQENFSLLQNQNIVIPILNMGLSVIVGLMAVSLGFYMAKFLVG